MGTVQLEISSNLEAILKRVGDLEVSVKRLTDDVDDYNKKSTAGFDKTAKSVDEVNDEIKVQQKILKDMEREAEKLAKTQDKHSKQQAAYYKRLKADIGVARQELEQMKVAQEETNRSAQLGEKIYGRLKGAIAGAFTVAAILKFTKEVIASTDATSDWAEQIKTGVGEGLNFLARAIATLDFSNLIQGFKDAYNAGVQYAKVQDLLANRQRADEIRKLEIEGEIIRLRGLARLRWNDVKEREDYIKQIEDLEKEKLEISRRIAQEDLDSKLTLAEERSGMDMEEIKDFVSNFRLYEAAIQEGEQLRAELNELQRESLQPLVAGVSPEGVIMYRENTEALAKYGNRMAELTDIQKENLALYDKTNLLADKEGKIRNQIADAIKNVVRAENEYETGIASMSRIRNSIYSEMQQQDKERLDSQNALLKAETEYFAKLWELYGGPPTFDEWNKSFIEQENFIKENIAAFQAWAEENPMYSGENAFDAKEFDKAMEEAKQKILELEQFANDHPFWEALGFENEEQIQAAKDYASEIFNLITSVVDAQVAASERLVDDLNTRIDEQEELVNREFELKKEGLGNNYALEQENLVKMQQARDQAIKDREKNIRIQRTLSTIEASISLITAAANIMKGFSSIPVVGVILGIAAVGAMIAAFIASQSSINDATQFAKGGKLKGLRHSEGGIPIPGTGIEVEGDEYVTNRRATAKYLPLLEAINKDDRGAMKLFFDRKFINKLPGTIGTAFDIDKSTKLGEIVRELRRGKAEIIYGDGYIIERIGSYTKRINLN